MTNSASLREWPCATNAAQKEVQMKNLRKPTLVLATTLLLLSGFVATATPSEESIAAVVTDVTRLDALVKGASADDAADTVIAVIAAIQKSRLTAAQKSKNIALVVARIVALDLVRAPAVMARLVPALPPELVPITAASAVVAAGADSRAVFTAMEDSVKDNDALAEAVRTASTAPQVPLGTVNIRAVQDMVRAMALAVVPAIPSQEPTTVPLVPIIPVGGKYPGQDDSSETE